LQQAAETINGNHQSAENSHSSCRMSLTVAGCR
jgi:hypothetical protein